MSNGGKALGLMREARALLKEEQEQAGSRELAVAITNLETAILWRQEDARLKTPATNEEKRR